jgi:putative MFS transporter
MQWRIWALAAAGKFFEGLVVFMTGVAMPLISDEFQMSPAQHGVVGAASLFGILVGAVSLGSLSDHFGRKRMFVIEMFIFMIFLCLLVVSPSYLWAGCLPVRYWRCSRLRLPDRALDHFRKYSQQHARSTSAGRLAVTVGRLSITESAHGYSRTVKSSRLSSRRLGCCGAPLLTRAALRWAAAIDKPPGIISKTAAYGALFSKDNRRATILASVPWFLQDLGTYGIGIFTPAILAASIGHKTKYVRNLAELINNDILAARGAALIDILLIVGIVCAILLADRVGRIRLQIIGFVRCATGLLLASFSGFCTGEPHVLLIFLGFMLFNFMTNLGPNAQTYLLAGEVFPTRVRGMGAGFAAAFAKIGAVITAFLFPILLADIGTQTLLYILVGTSLLGAAVTRAFQIETAGINLETIGK